MKNSANILPLRFCIIVTCLFSFLVAFSPLSFSKSDEVAIKINLVSDDRVVFYQGKESGLKEKSRYEVVVEGEKIGEVEVVKITDCCTTAEAKSGEYAAYELKDVVLKLKEEKKEKPPKEKPEKVEKQPKEPEPETVTVKPSEELPEIEAPVKPAAKPTVIYNALVRYESHSDANNPDDFLYTMLTASRQYQENVVGSLFYIFKQNLDENENDAHIYGITASKLLPRNTTYSLSYIFTREDFGAGESLDDNALVLGVTGTIKKTPLYDYKVGARYTSRHADIGQRTTDLSLQYNYKFNPITTGRLSYLYTYSTTLNAHTTDQIGAALSQSLDRNRRLSLEYLFVDKTYSTPAISVTPDNDGIFRFSYLHTF
ncbi:MAG: hypothetical protein AB1546_13180 [bacterium]